MLELLRQHRTNDEIADRLGITLDGAKYHVSSILSKLGVASREEAAAWTPEEARRWPAGRWAVVAVGAGVIAVAVAGLALLAVAVLLNEDDDSPQAADFGPLAVIDGLGGSDARGGSGPIHIGDTCVTMTAENGETLLLIWHAAEVRWDGQNREITFTSASSGEDEAITLRNGDTIEVGGESWEGDVPVTRDVTWLATPHPACTGRKWAVNSVVKD